MDARRALLMLIIEIDMKEINIWVLKDKLTDLREMVSIFAKFVVKYFQPQLH